MTTDHDFLHTWIGRMRTCREWVAPRIAAQLAATFDYPEAPGVGAPLPPLWHWALFPPLAAHSALDADGHSTRGGFLPPIALPGRMWAGSRIRFERPIVIGQEVVRTSRIVDITPKAGRSGELIFVRILHQFEDADGLQLSEEQDVVYRETSTDTDQKAAPLAPAECTWRREIVPEPVLLFRYSASTFNAHRIHYDRTYAREQEGYPGLVVHGPLIASFLVELIQRHLPQARISSFTFKAINPLFDDAPFCVCATVPADPVSVKLWAVNAAGILCVDACATLDAPVSNFRRETTGYYGRDDWSQSPC